MSDSRKTEIIRGLFAAYQFRDRAAVERAFADDFTFTCPYDDRIGKAAYFERCWPISQSMIAANTIERIVVQGDSAFVTYQCRTTDDRKFRNTEFFTFDGERIKSIDVYFGATYKDGAFLKQGA